MSKSSNNKTLLIISVSLVRNIRYILFSSLFQVLQDKFQILIVSPFGEIETFKKEFGGKKVKFINFDKSVSSLPPFFQTIFNMTTFFRFWGYRFKFRHKRMWCYWIEVNALLSCKNKGLVLWIKKLRLYCLAWLGQFNCLWKTLDSLFGRFLYPGDILKNIRNEYDKIILIQSANWGYQSRYLAYYSKKHKFKKVFLPYTTDQIIGNGFFMSEFDVIFSQGRVEEAFLKTYHHFPSQKIIQMGNLWFRNMDELNQNIQIKSAGEQQKKKILYAGGSDIHFPKETEFKAIDFLLKAIKEGKIPLSKIIYRPIIYSKTELDKIFSRYANEELVEISLAQMACYGLYDYPENITIREELINYLKEVRSTDLFIMSAGTSMCFDFVYHHIPIISNCIDSEGILERTGFSVTLNEDVCHVFPPGSVTVYAFEDLVEEVRKALIFKDERRLERNKKQLLRKWDYNVNDFKPILGAVESLTVE